MGKQTRYDFTPEQEKAIGEFVADNWGSNFQTGYEEDDQGLYIYAQAGPKLPIKRASIDREGTVTFGPA